MFNQGLPWITTGKALSSIFTKNTLRVWLTQMRTFQGHRMEKALSAAWKTLFSMWLATKVFLPISKKFMTFSNQSKKNLLSKEKSSAMIRKRSCKRLQLARAIILNNLTEGKGESINDLLISSIRLYCNQLWLLTCSLLEIISQPPLSK